MSELPEIIPGQQEELIGLPVKSFEAYNYKNADGVPTGGCVDGCGFTIAWQNGELAEPDTAGVLRSPNGAFVEEVLAACVNRLEFYQDSSFANEYNEKAIALLNEAIQVLNDRTAERQERGVEGTHQI